jgi:hypothetical protein
MFIPDPNFFFHPGSASKIKNLSILTPKKWFLSTQKYDLDPDFYPSRIPDPGVKKVPDPGSGSATLVVTCST